MHFISSATERSLLFWFAERKMTNRKKKKRNGKVNEEWSASCFFDVETRVVGSSLFMCCGTAGTESSWVISVLTAVETVMAMGGSRIFGASCT